MIGVKNLFSHSSTAQRVFPLLDRMNLALPFKTEEKHVIYSGEAMGIDTESLAYYVLSVLWKGSVHEWTTLNEQEEVQLIFDDIKNRSADICSARRDFLTVSMSS